MKCLFYTIILASTLTSCEDAGVNLPSLSEQEDLKESVFRYQLNNASLDQIYFLTILILDPSTGKYTRTDPSDEFMSRFKDLPQIIKKYSESAYSDGVVDKSTGQKGIRLRCEEILWLSKTEAYVYGGYEQNGLSASGNRYRVRFESGKWVVIESHLIWIS